MSNYNRDQAKQRAEEARNRLRENLTRLNGHKEAAPAMDVTPEPVPRSQQVIQHQDSVQAVELPEAPQHEAPEVTEDVAPQIDYAAELKRAEDRWKAADALLKNQGSEFRRAKAEAEAARRAAEEEAARLRAELEETRVSHERARPLTSEDLSRYFTKEQIERFGEDECRNLITVQRAISDDSNKVTRASIQREVKEALAGVEVEKKNLQALRSQQFLSTVDTLVPDWRAIDNEPEFIAWLEEVDELRGTTRRQLGEEASAALDAKRFAAVYNTYKASRAKPATVASPKRVLPNGVPPVSAPTHEPKFQPMTQSEVIDYRNKLARGHYKRNPKDFARDSERFKRSISRA